MCGHVGFIGAHKFDHSKAFLNMLHMDVVRGDDSTGVLLVNVEGKEHAVFKDIGTPHYLMLDHKVKNAIRNWPRSIALGHNRAATRGKVNELNAHPFEKGNIIGAHNGTIDHAAKGRLVDGNRFDTDSEAIFHSIDQKGIAWTWAQITGAATLVWWEKSRNQLKFITNNKRPFFFTYTEKGDAMFWASEDWMLTGALARNNIAHGELYSPSSDYLFTFKFKKGKVTKQSTKLEAFQYPKSQVSSKSQNKKDKGSASPNETAEPLTVDDLFETEEERKANQAALDRFRENFDNIEWSNRDKDKDDPVRMINGVPHTEKEFDQHYHLCAWCQGVLDFEDPDITFFDNTTALHNHCHHMAWDNNYGVTQ